MSPAKLAPHISAPPNPNGRSSTVFAAAACGVFLLTGAAFVPLLGIQNDEALFAAALLPPRAEVYSLHVGRHHLPLMLMSYLGALKSMLYLPIIRAFGTGVWVTRIPVLLMGTASVWLFFLLMRRVAGDRAAVIACGLLAVDSTYLLSSCFDWGPVALQHLLMAAGMLLLVRFWQERWDLALVGAFFLFGLALWDKAVAAWMLNGAGIAALTTYPRQILGLLTLRRLGLAALAFAIGALPLIVYNLNVPGATFHGKVSYETGNIRHKLLVLRKTVDGSALFDFLVNEDRDTRQPHPARTAMERTSAAVASFMGNSRTNLMWPACFAALLLVSLAPGPERRLILFFLVAMALAWAQMAFTVNAGTAVHHTILLWPLPQAVVGVSFAAASRRLGRRSIPILMALVIILMASSLAVSNQYYRYMKRNGGSSNWTDAIFSLSEALKGVGASGIFAMDWNILDNLRLINGGRLPLFMGTDLISKNDRTLENRAAILDMVSHPDHLFISHTQGMEFFKGLSARLVQWAESQGYQREILAVIPDSYGRPTFEIYRFAAVHRAFMCCDRQSMLLVGIPDSLCGEDVALDTLGARHPYYLSKTQWHRLEDDVLRRNPACCRAESTFLRQSRGKQDGTGTCVQCDGI